MEEVRLTVRRYGRRWSVGRAGLPLILCDSKEEALERARRFGAPIVIDESPKVIPITAAMRRRKKVPLVRG